VGGVFGRHGSLISLYSIIVTPYHDFVETFGKEINFGFYCENNLPNEIKKSIRSILTIPAYEALCISAHNAVKNHTWDSYISNMLKKVESIGTSLLARV
jgi:hypothetical protein